MPGAIPFSPAGGGIDSGLAIWTSGGAESVETLLAAGSGALARLVSYCWSLATIVALFPLLSGGESAQRIGDKGRTETSREPLPLT